MVVVPVTIPGTSFAGRGSGRAFHFVLHIIARWNGLAKTLEGGGEHSVASLTNRSGLGAVRSQGFPPLLGSPASGGIVRWSPRLAPNRFRGGRCSYSVSPDANLSHAFSEASPCADVPSP